MQLHRTLTAAAVVGILSAGGAMATAASSSAATPSGAAVRAAHPTAPVLRPGDHGTAVRAWQQDIDRVAGKIPGVSHIAVDGRFGPRTTAATKNFQRFAHIAVDGIVGPHARAAMDTALHGSPAPSGHVALTALVTGTGKHAHLIVHERGAVAGGGPWLGDYDLKLDGHLVESGIGAANCPNKPVQSFDVTRRPAPIHLTAGRHVIQIRQDYCKIPGAAQYVPTTHTVAFTAH